MSFESPYSHLFQLFGQPPKQNVESINAEAFRQMISLLSRPVEAAGRCVLLRAPRAGYGKSHLLSRVQHQLGGSHEFVLLQPADGYRVDAEAALTDVLSKLIRILPGSGGLTFLDIIARKVMAMGLEPLVRSGEVPCQDRESALSALHNRPVETFDFHHPTAVTAHWTRENYDQLGPRLVVEITELIGAPMREVGFWVDVLFRYAVTPLDQPGRAGMLMGAVASSTAISMTERLSTLLKLLSQLQRVVLVADELEGMSADEEAALRLAAFVTALRHGAARVDIIISVNDDVWENAFLPRLSDGLKDRLSEAEVRLGCLTREQALQLLQSRDPAATVEQLSSLPLDGENLYSRGILRAASAAWMGSPLAHGAVSTETLASEPAGADNTPPVFQESPFSQATVTEPVIPPPAQPVVPLVTAPVATPVADNFIPQTVEPVTPQVSAHLEEWIELAAPVIQQEPARHAPPTQGTPSLTVPEIVSVATTPPATPSAPEEVATFSWEKYGASPLTGEIGPVAPAVERPVFVPPAMMSSTATTPNFPPFQRVEEPVVEPVQSAVSHQVFTPPPAAAPVPVSEPQEPVLAPWWAERRAAHANSVFQENHPVSDLDGASSPFTFATSPPATDEAMAPVSKIEPTAQPVDFASLENVVPQAPVVIPVAPQQRYEPREAAPFDFSSLQETAPQAPAPAPAPAATPDVIHSWPVSPTDTSTSGEWGSNPDPDNQLENYTEETPPHPPAMAERASGATVVVAETTSATSIARSSEIDRVDELLRQFRDRYGRS